MNHKIAIYGLTEEQRSHLVAALPEEYEVTNAECVTDLIVTDAVCCIVDASKMSTDALNTLLAYYMDTDNWLDETVVWLGETEIPELLSFVYCDCFLDLLTVLDNLIEQAQIRYDSMQKYSGEYAYLPKRAIEESLEQNIYAALHRKYGDAPDENILSRLHRELTALLETDAVAELAAAYELTRWLQHNNHPFWVDGDAASGLIPYLLEITDVNPMPPHLHCRKCHHIIWKTACKDGFDIPAESCERCGTATIPDGHDLVWQEYASYGRVPTYVIHTPYDLQDEIISWVQNHWLQQVKGCDWSKATPLDKEYEYHCNICFKPDIHTACFGEKAAASHRDALLRIAQEDWVQRADFGFPVPQNIADAVAQEGVFKSVGNDMRCAKHLLHGGLNVTDLITCREDVFFYLKSHRFVDKDAFKGMCSVRKGRDFPTITDEMRTTRDKWVLKFCEGLDWLPSRASILARLFFRYRAGDVPKPHSGLSTGFAAIDACIKGMQPGEVILVGGRPGMGKSSFARGVAEHLEKQGKKVAYFDLTAPKSLAEFEQKIRDELPDLAVVDEFRYLNDYDKTRQTAAALMQRIKSLAKELQIPIVVLMNLTRDPETRPDPSPVTTDIPHTEQILPFVDTVLLLYRRAYYDPFTDRSSARCVIAKASRCGYQVIPLRWDDNTNSFEGMDSKSRILGG